VTGFLYPFLDAEERDQDALLRDLAASASAKAAESATLRASTVEANAGDIAAAAAEMARRFAAGGRMFAFGNGGSSTDVATLVTLFARPPVAARTAPPPREGVRRRGGRPLPAWSLAADQAILTALGNDVGFDLVFARQLIARAGPGDIAVAMSTSGSSRDLMAGFREARARGMYTVGFAGYDGGEFAASSDVDVCFVVRSQSVHRIQEAQALVGYTLWAAVHEYLDHLDDREQP
jgi:D-sedoheptulose 7-phosphate isomerase